MCPGLRYPIFLCQKFYSNVHKLPLKLTTNQWIIVLGFTEDSCVATASETARG